MGASPVWPAQAVVGTGLVIAARVSVVGARLAGSLARGIALIGRPQQLEAVLASGGRLAVADPSGSSILAFTMLLGFLVGKETKRRRP